MSLWSDLVVNPIMLLIDDLLGVNQRLWHAKREYVSFNSKIAMRCALGSLCCTSVLTFAARAFRSAYLLTKSTVLRPT